MIGTAKACDVTSGQVLQEFNCNGVFPHLPVCCQAVQLNCCGECLICSYSSKEGI